MLTPRDYRYFDVALSAAKTSQHHKARIGAVIVLGGDILSVGVNRTKSHPAQMRYNSFRQFEDASLCHHHLHAELDALLKLRRRDITSARIYVARDMRKHERGMCRPCNACLRAIKDANITDIYYTTTEGFAYEKILK